MDSQVQEIKDKLDIVEVIGSYIKIQKAGVNFRANCPFHNEKTPSFNISPARQIWHCFGCSLGGDVISFVEKIDNLDFKDALKLLADKVGVKLKTTRPDSYAKEDEKLEKINAFAAKLFQRHLRSRTGKTALEYLNKRGLSELTIDQWQIGFAPDGFNNLRDALATKKITDFDGLKAGVLSKNDRGSIYDRFRNRITFPIFNINNSIVGFTARVLDPNDTSAKYINSPETPIYNKSRIIFGLNFAKTEIRKKDYCIIVEGQMDCIKAHQAGFNNTVATSGTAFTDLQLSQLKRYSKNIILIFDSDSAGEAALLRVADIALEIGLNVKVVRLEGVKDPDELISKDAKLFAKAVKNAEWLIDYLTKQGLKELTSLDQAKFVSNNILPRVYKLNDPVEQDHYLRELSQVFNLSDNALRKKGELKQSIKQTVPEIEKPIASDEGDLVEKQILGGLIYFPEFRQEAILKIKPDYFEKPELRSLFEEIVNSEGVDLAVKFAKNPLAEECQFVVESLLQDGRQNEEVVLRELGKSFSLIRLNSIKRELQKLSVQLKNAEVTSQKELAKDIREKVMLLLQARTELERS